MAKRKPRTPVLHSDYGTAERSSGRQGPVEVEEVPVELQDTKHRSRLRVVEVSDPLYRLKRNGTINRRQRDAGLKLRELWVRAGIEQSVTSAYSELVGQGSIISLHDGRVDHYRRWSQAIRQLPLASVDPVIATVMQERLPRHKIRHLKAGLDRLVRFWGI